MRQDDPSFHLDNLGPLLGLLGTWEGSHGLSVTPLPNFSSQATRNQNAQFRLKHSFFNDTITFSPILAGVANRGYRDAKQVHQDGQGDQFLLGVEYTQKVHRVSDPTGPEPDFKPELLHVETGQWIFNIIPGIDPRLWTVTRMASIPHGNVLLALGKHSVENGEDVKQFFAQGFDQSFTMMPFDIGNSTEFRAAREYTKLYRGLGGAGENPATVLVKGLGDEVSGMRAVRLDVSTMAAGGGMLSLPNVEAQVKPANFNSTFWIETFPDGRQQLQYRQTILFQFQASLSKKCFEENPPTVECLIKWPHTMASTLKKVKDYVPGPDGDGFLTASVR